MVTPTIRQVVFDCARARPLADFYRALFGLEYRETDVTPRDGEDWLVLRNPSGGPQLAFQQLGDDCVAPVWGGQPPMQAHLDTTVESVEDLVMVTERAVSLGATLRHDRIEDPDEPLRVFTDPAGHPFCIFV